MERFIQNILFFLVLLLAFLLASCTPVNRTDKENSSSKEQEINSKPDYRNIVELSIDGDDIMYDMTVHLFQQFSLAYPMAKGQIAFSSSTNAIERLKRNEVDIVMSASKCEYNKDIDFECVPIAKDFLTLIVNFNNLTLQRLALHGLSRTDLRKIFTNEILEWNTFNTEITEIQPIAKYISNKNSGTANHIAALLDLPKEQLIAIDVSTEKELLANVINIPISIGFCSHTLAYDFQSKMRRRGIYIVGIDYNNSKTLNDEELIYDELSDLQKAVQRKTAPNELVRELTFMYNPQSEKIDDIKLFITFAKKNRKSLIENFRFFDIN